MLDVQIDGDHVHLSWNANDPRLRPAQSGVLKIYDGQRERTIPLSGRELKSNNAITYVPTADKVTVQLELAGNNMPPQQQTVLAVLRHGHLQTATTRSTTTAPQQQRTENATANTQTGGTEARSAYPRTGDPHLLQITAVKYRGGEGLPSRTYRPPQPTREATPRVPEHFARLLTSPVEINVQIKVDRHGNVVTARPVSQIGSLRASADDQAVLAHAVIDAARQWRFAPAELHSRPVASEVILSFRFQARG